MILKCTDRRIKGNMGGSSQNIETISTQFRILSTVKATMLSKYYYYNATTVTVALH